MQLLPRLKIQKVAVTRQCLQQGIQGLGHGMGWEARETMEKKPIQRLFVTEDGCGAVCFFLFFKKNKLGT